MAEALEAGTAYLNILAGASGLQKDVSKKVKSVSAPDIIAKIDADISALQKKADEARAKIAAIKSATPDPQISLDISDLEAKAAVARQKITDLKQLEATPKVNADIAAAEAQLGRIETKLSALEYKRSTAKVDADTAAAESELRGIESQITRLNGQRATVQLSADGAQQTFAELSAVDQKRRSVDGSNASVNIAASGGAQASGILGAIVAGLAAVASVAPAAAAGLATVLSAGSGAAQAAGAVTAGFSGIGDAIKAVEADEKSAATASSGAASSRVNSAGQIASAQSALAAAVMQADRVAITGAEAVADAARAEAQAAIAADRARITSAQQVAAARRAVADAIVSASERTQAAERAVGRAQESVTFAQEALTRARRDAAEANEDLQLSLSGIAISERRALLSQKKAQAALAKGSSDPLEQEELKLNVDEAEQNLKEVRERYGDLRQEQAAFAKGGVEGSTQVASATRSLKDAQTSAADAQRALTAAQRDGSRQVQDAAIAAAQAQQQAAWTVQDAQTAQSDAARATAKAARDAGWAQQDAARGVSEAQRGLQQALASTAQQAGATGAAGKQSAFALAQLTPAGRDFVDFWSKTWKPSMQDVTDSVAGSMLPRVQTAMFQLLGLQPTLKKGLTDTGAVLGDLAIKGSNLATSPAFRRDFAAIMDSNNRSLTSWGQAGLYGVDAARALTVAGLPLQERLARTAESAMQGVTSFILQKEASGELGQFMQFAGDKAAQLWGVTMDLVGAAYQLGVAIAPVGSVVMDLVGGMFQLIGEFAQANPGLVQFAAAAGIGLAAINALAKGAVALKASAALSMTGLTTLGGGLATLLNPQALASSAAMQRLGQSGATAGALLGSMTSSVTGSATAMGTGAKYGMAFTSQVSRLASYLPALGLATLGVVSLIDAMTVSTSEATDALMKGGQGAAAMRAELAENDKLYARDTVNGYISGLLGINTTTAEANAALEEQRSKMTNLEAAQSRATQAQGDYELAVRNFGASSPQAVAALGDLNAKTRDVEIAQIAVREKTDLATAAVLYQRDQILAGLDANLRARLAAQQLAKDQDALAQAIGRYGAGSQQAKDAGLQLEQSQLRQAEAAKSSAGGQNAYVQSIRDMVTATKGEFTPTLTGLIGSLDASGLAAIGAQLKFDAAGRAVATFPNGKTVVLDANTSPVYPALQAVKLAVDSTRGTIGVDADTGPGVMMVGGFKLQTDATRGVVTIDGNISLADQQRLGIQAKTDGTTGTMWINGNPVPCDGKLNGAKFNVDTTTGVMTIAGDPNKADDATRGAHDRANAPAKFNVDADYTRADQAAEGWWARQWREIKEFFGFQPARPGPPGHRTGGAVMQFAAGGLVQAYAAGGRVQGFPTGGNVRGPGGPTADKIPAMLSDGEYVIRADAVRKVGVPALDAINHLRDGGMVAPLHLAAGGSAAAPDMAAASVPAAAVDAAIDPAAAASSDALAGSLSAAAVAAGVLNPALAALALTQSSLLVPAQDAVVLGQQAMAAAVWTTLAPALGLYQQQVGVAAPLANQALQTAQLNTRLDTDATALNTGLNSTAMATSIAAMSLAAQLQHQGLRAGQFATRLDTDATRLNSQLNNTAMTLSTQGMSLQGQLQHQLLRAGQLATQQHTTLTAQNTAANNTNMIATTQAMSAQNQVHLANLRGAQGVTTTATTAFADAWRAQLGRTIPDSGNPIKWVINYPMRSIVDSWNNLDAQFALGKHVNPAVPNFATGGVFSGGGPVSGPGGPTDDRVNARLSDGEFVVRESVARAHMPFLNALNHGQAEAKQAAGGRHARMPGYAAGGVVAAQQFARAQAGKPYSWGGVGPASYDCSGLVSAVVNVARGQAPHRRLGTAGSFPWAGFTPGLTSALSAGASSSHIAGTLCIIGSMLIDGPNGPRRIDEIEAGDWVWSFDNGRRKPHQVVRAWFSAHQDVFEVRMTKGRSVTSSANHPFLVVRKQSDRHWGPVEMETGAEWTPPTSRQPKGSAGVLQCSVSTCDRTVVSLFLCAKHHEMHAKYGDPRLKRSLVRERWDTEWVRLDELKRGDLVVRSRAAEDTGTLTTLPDGREVTPDTAWLIGHLVGDGSLVGAPGKIRVSCYKDEYTEHVLRAWRALTGKEGRFYGYDSSSPPVALTDRPTHEVFRQMGMCVKGPRKRVPADVWLWPRHLQKAFLDGYADADGCYSHGNEYVLRSYTSASEQLIADARAMHIAHGDGVSNVQHRVRNGSGFPGGKDSWAFDVYAGTDDGGGVRRENQSGLHDLMASWEGDYTLSRVQSVTPKGAQDTYDITVEGAHAFSVDGIQLHNSGMNFEARTTGKPVYYGPPAVGADNGQFNKRASLPMVGGRFVSGGAGGAGAGIDVAAAVNGAFAKATREVADVPKFFGPSAQVARDQGVARFGLDKVKGVATAKLSEMFASAGLWGPIGAGAPFIVKQISDAARIYGKGVDGATIGVATGLVESNLRNLPGGDRDSVGVFQQRPSMGWGTVAECMNVLHAAGSFFKRFPANWRSMVPGDVAQSVQRSGFPAKYQPRMGYARQLVGQHGGAFDAGGVAYGKGYLPKATDRPERVLSPVQTGQYDTLGQLVGRNGIRVEGLEPNTTRGGAQPLVGTVENHYHGDQRGGDMRDLAHTLRRARVAAGS